MKSLFKKLARQAMRHPQRILFSEPHDLRVLKAAVSLASKNILHPVLFIEPQRLARLWRWSPSLLKKMRVVSPSSLKPAKEVYAKRLVELQSRRGNTISLHDAQLLLHDPMYQCVMMLDAGEVDGVVSGSTWPKLRTLRPAIRVFRDSSKNVSSFFIMKHDGEFYLFADCSVNITPTEQELASIAVSTAATAKTLLGLSPRVAMLSFSTHGSSKHPLAVKMRKATAIAKQRCPSLIIDGELQADAALKPAIGRLKSKKYSLPGAANILIFPDLQSANISYKLVEWLGHYEAVGPIVQNLRKPVNDLSRGCTPDDIVKVGIITAIQAQNGKKNVTKDTRRKA